MDVSTMSIWPWRLYRHGRVDELPWPCRLMWYGHVDSVGMAMSLTAVRLCGTMRLINEQENSLSYALTPNLGRPAKSVTVKRYSAQMKSTGTFGDAELQESLASESRRRSSSRRISSRSSAGSGNCRPRDATDSWSRRAAGWAANTGSLRRAARSRFGNHMMIEK